jgi:hypothetical protein
MYCLILETFICKIFFNRILDKTFVRVIIPQLICNQALTPFFRLKTSTKESPHFGQRSIPLIHHHIIYI